MSMCDGTGKVYFTAEEWTEIILEAAPFLRSTELAIGPITQIPGGGFEVEYAFSDDCHPKDWSSPPWWLPRKAAK